MLVADHECVHHEEIIISRARDHVVCCVSHPSRTQYSH
jgi:hypothetical protein